MNCFRNEDMIFMAYSSARFIINDEFKILSSEIIIESIEKILDELIKELGLTAEKFDVINVFINDSGSYALKDAIYVSVRDVTNSNFKVQDMFEKIFRHELVHVLVERYYGMAPPILWEGLPIYLADRKFRKKFHNFDDHAFCQFLLNKNFLPELKSILCGHHFYARRHDYIVDVESSSFTGYLIENHGSDKLMTVFSNFKQPTPENPVLNINELMTNIYGKNFFQLENLWHEFLRDVYKPADLIDDKYLNREFCRDIQLKSIHCKFCYTPMPPESKICTECGADKKIELEIR